jgi:hypothetical protein
VIVDTISKEREKYRKKAKTMDLGLETVTKPEGGTEK